jgi:hypothetical protein
MRALRQVYMTLAEDARQEAMSPAAEWLLDNFHVIAAAARDIYHDLPPGFFRRLPHVASDEFAGLPRIYALARELIGSSAGRLDAQRLQRFISAFQSVTPLTIGELWALPSALKLALLDHLQPLIGYRDPAQRRPEPLLGGDVAHIQVDVPEADSRSIRWGELPCRRYRERHDQEDKRGDRRLHRAHSTPESCGTNNQQGWRCRGAGSLQPAQPRLPRRPPSANILASCGNRPDSGALRRASSLTAASATTSAYSMATTGRGHARHEACGTMPNGSTAARA